MLKPRKRKGQKAPLVDAGMTQPDTGSYRFAQYISPQHADKMHRRLMADHPRTLEMLEDAAKQPTHRCGCGEPIWRLGMTGMCFGCTTGEHDASDDYELAVYISGGH